MKIYQSLADASLYRTIALIPEQIMFGLTLARDPEMRQSPETDRILRLGREFCDVFQRVSTPEQPYEPPTSSAATIASGIRELEQPLLTEWQGKIGAVKTLIDDLLLGEDPDPARIDGANKALKDFASTAKRRLSVISDSEPMLPAW